MVPFSSQQIYYSLLHREAEYELVPLSVDRGLGVLVWSPLAGGLLTGKYRRDDPLPEGSRRALGWGEPPIYDEGRMWETIETLVSVAEGRGSSPAQVALAWLLGRPAVASVIVGARREEQLHDTLGAAELKLSPEETARLEEVSRPPLIYPYWHQLEMGPGRVSRGDESLLGQYRRSEG
jgi:aryl-alcohol dehydrogenase-like predicted oxidoreductase